MQTSGACNINKRLKLRANESVFSTCTTPKPAAIQGTVAVFARNDGDLQTVKSASCDSAQVAQARSNNRFSQARMHKRRNGRITFDENIIEVTTTHGLRIWSIEDKAAVHHRTASPGISNSDVNSALEFSAMYMSGSAGATTSHQHHLVNRGRPSHRRCSTSRLSAISHPYCCVAAPARSAARLCATLANTSRSSTSISPSSYTLST